MVISLKLRNGNPENGPCHLEILASLGTKSLASSSIRKASPIEAARLLPRDDMAASINWVAVEEPNSSFHDVDIEYE